MCMLTFKPCLKTHLFSADASISGPKRSLLALLVRYVDIVFLCLKKKIIIIYYDMAYMPPNGVSMFNDPMLSVKLSVSAAEIKRNVAVCIRM